MLIDPRSTHRFEPEGSGIVYLLRVPKVADRPRFRREVMLENGRQWNVFDMLDALADGVRQCIPEGEAQREGMLAAVEDAVIKWKAIVDYDGLRADHNLEYRALLEEVNPTPRLKEIILIIRDLYPRYNSMCADNEVYHEIVAAVAARMFLAGWEGGNAPYTRGSGEPPDEILRQIPRAHLMRIGTEIGRLLEPEPDKLGNSSSLSGSAPVQTASNGIGTQPQNDLSPTTSGDAQSSASPN